jgi:hypothetical protein
MHIRHPDLDRPHPLGSQPLPVLAHLAPGGGAAGLLGVGVRGSFGVHGGFSGGYM